MGNRASRELRLKEGRDATWLRLRSGPWRPDGTIRAFGSGTPRIQIVRLPTFSAPTFWEVCQRGAEWLLYTATVVDPEWHNLLVRGYEPVPFAGGVLQSYFDRFAAITLPAAPPLSGMVGLDGSVTQIALFGDSWSQVRYQWWSDHPRGWDSLVHVTDELLGVLGSPGAGV